MMMRGLVPALLLTAAGVLTGTAPAHPHPDPVQSLGVTRHADGTVSLSWTLPADPSITGLTIDRERLDGPYDLDVFILVGPASNFTDTTAHGSRSYRYTVYTRDGSGNFSAPVWVETYEDHHHDDDHHHRSHWSCHSAIGVLPVGVAFPAAVLVIAALLVFRRR